MPDFPDTENCTRCGREFSVDDPRMGEWEEFHREDGTVEWLCPGCQTVEDSRTIAASEQAADEEWMAMSDRAARLQEHHPDDWEERFRLTDEEADDAT